jgi:hypothetical protein
MIALVRPLLAKKDISRSDLTASRLAGRRSVESLTATDESRRCAYTGPGAYGAIVTLSHNE